jgi:hypothetical protein
MRSFTPQAEKAIIMPIAIMQVACTKKNANRMPATTFVCSTNKWIKLLTNSGNEYCDR